MLYNCIWESSLRAFLNAAEGRRLIPIRVKHSERGWHCTQGPEVMLLFCYLCFFYRVHYYAPLQHIAAKRRMGRCNSISRLLKWPIDIQNSALFQIHHIYRWICGIQMFPLPEGKCDLVQQLCVTSRMTLCWRNMILKQVLMEPRTGDMSYNNTVQLN